jgi:hypothetical protein
MWELINSKSWDFMGGIKELTHRARVPGGWLIKYRFFYGRSSPAPNALLFIPDHDGLWQVEEGKQQWELIDRSHSPNFNEQTLRMRMPDGWLVRVGYFVGEQLSMAMTYFPDGNQEWIVDKKP